MMYLNKLVISTFIFVTIIKITQSSFNCKSTTCACGQSANQGYDLDCPDYKNPQVQISLFLDGPKNFEVDCRENKNYVASLPKTYLPPHIGHLSLDYLGFKTCSIPENITLRYIMNQLQISSTHKFRISYSNLNNIQRNDLDGLQSIEKLEVLANTINYVPDDLIYDLENLTILDMKSNNIIIPQTFFQMSKKLENIELAENFLPENTTGMFDGLIDLLQLNIWNMNIKEINKSLFSSLHNLKILDLSINYITTLDKDVFSTLVNLQQISLKRNNLRELSEGLFTNNKNLEKILIDENYNLTYVSSNMFSNLPKLQRVSINNCNLSKLPENIFWGSNNIVELDISYNYLGNLPAKLFQHLTELKYLNLMDNEIESLPDELFKNLKQLEELKLNHNKIKLTGTAFYGLFNLNVLHLNNNGLERVYATIFRKLSKLKELDLSHNRLTLFEDSTYDRYGNWSPIGDMPELDTLYLNHNNISIIFVDWRLTRMRLRKLDLSFNIITNLTYNDFDYLQSNIDVDLKNNRITDINLDSAELQVMSSWNNSVDHINNQKNIKIDLANNPLHCSCNLYNLYRYYDGKMDPKVRTILELKHKNLTCATPELMAGAPVDKIASHTFRCELTNEYEMYSPICLNHTKCYFKPSTSILSLDYSYSRLAQIPTLSNKMQDYNIKGVEVYLRGNNLTEMPKPGMGYEHVSLLDISHNYISKLDWLPSSLYALYLNDNNITSLNKEQLSFFNKTNLHNVTFYNNPWQCGCENIEFMKYLQNNFKKVNELYNITCLESNLEIVSLTVDVLCPLPKEIIIFLSVTIALVSLLVAILGALYYRYHMEIKVWLYAHQQCLWFVTEEEVDKDKLYDAFISYSHKDEQFIISELLANLEEGPRPYKLCLHYRNWLPGEFITTNIAKSIAESRRTIVILSSNFLESEWGKMEFRTAHTQAINEKRTRVIIVLLGNIPIDDLDDELKAYLNTNTYVQWGDPWFWDKLRYALPHAPKFAKQNFQNLDKIKIYDDKSDLINEPTTPPIGTTPPADKLTFDPLIKDGALNVRLVNGSLVNNKFGILEQNIR